MAQEEVIIEIKVESADAIKGIDGLYNNITALKKEQEKLNQQFKEGEISLEEYNKQSKAVSTELVKEEKAFKNLTNAIDVQEDSINALRESNKQLTKERNNLNLSTAEGQKRLKEINAQLDRNNEKIRTNVSGLEKQKINIGNYASALDGIVPGLGGFITGVEGATTAGRAFIATPLGATLLAIGVALAALINYFKTTGEGEDLLAEKTAQLNAVFKQFSNVLNATVGFVLDSSKGFEDLSKSLGIFATSAYIALTPLRLVAQGLQKIASLAPGAEAGAALAQGFDAAEEAAGKFVLKQKEVGLEIDKLLIQSKNRNLTEDERAAKLQKALDLEKGLLIENRKLKQEDLRLGLESIRINNERAFNSINVVGKTNEQIAKALLDQGSITDDQRKNLEALLGTITEVESGFSAFEEKLQNRQDALDLKREEQAQKRLEQLNKEREQQAALEAKWAAEDEKNRANAAAREVKAEEEKNKKLQAEAKKNADFLERIQKGITKIVADNEKAQADLRAKALADQQAKEQQLLQLRDQALAAADAIFGKTKEGQIALTLISTYLSAQKAFESQFNPIADVSSPIRGAIAAGLAIAQGLARVNEIRKTTMKSTSGGSPSSGSFNIGQPNGQTISSAATNPINQSFSVANAMSNMPPVYASWKEATEVQNRIKFKESLTTV